jgi:hypothetical protein
MSANETMRGGPQGGVAAALRSCLVKPQRDPKSATAMHREVNFQLTSGTF